MQPDNSSQREEASDMMPRRRRPGLRFFILVPVGLALLVSLIGAGCSGKAAISNGTEELPTFAYNSSMTLAGYKAAVRVREDLYAIPCFCGCGPSQGHTSMKDCFFNPDGSFSDHASNCHVCAEQAVDLAKWRDDGVSLKEARAQIEAKYSESGPGTNTPPLP